MTAGTLKIILTWLSVLAGAVTAALWVKSARVRVLGKDEGPAEGNYFFMSIVGKDGTDLLRTVEEQSVWNRRAATASAVTIGLQALATVIPDA